jgi:hypothetical protein
MSSTSTGGHQVRTGGPARTQTPTSPAPGKTAKSILARLDRISVWSLPFMFIGIIGTGFLFAFYDVFDINVSFIQSCVALKHGCTPANAVTALRVPVVLNLAGYVIGALALAYTLSTESFPTRARVTGFGVVDGVGHLGGGIGVLVIAPQIPNMTVLEAMLVISGFLVLAAIVAQFSPNTRGRYYEEISP